MRAAIVREALVSDAGTSSGTTAGTTQAAPSIRVPESETGGYDPLRHKHASILALARYLETKMRSEIGDLRSKILNDPDSIADNNKRIDLLTEIAEGLLQISTALEELARNPNQPIPLGKARKVVDRLAKEVQSWWENNNREAVDWMIRFPAMGAFM